ncbi:uncharacterized protein LOC131879639 isoform X2 [Tigriopus californicus]|uniref:uncharacterized protein LOC131879639 isoform X2 n=1 Tax=Tigriopus californicus TaxID=6832 RepID=UPI0027DA51C6|nr:uncharacterized protein LOC131879639 isoform X2 [Tigriopus californicus]
MVSTIFSVKMQALTSPTTCLVLALLSMCQLCQCQFYSSSTPSTQNLGDLEDEPYILDNGTPYRDMLTIGASKAVAKFAGRFQPQERNRIQQNRARPNQRQSPQFYSSTLSQPIGSRSSDSLDFVASRRIRIPADLERDRRLADRDEAIMVAEGNSKNEPERPRSSQFNRPRGFGGSTRFDFGRSQGRRPLSGAFGQSRPYSSGLSQDRPYAAALTASAPSSDNYQSFQSQGASYSTNVGYPSYSAGAPSPTAVSSLVGFDFSGQAYAPAHGQARAPAAYNPSRLSHPFSSPPSLPPIPTSTSIPVSPRLPTLGTPTVNYGGVVAHGTGGSYSYSSLG